MTTVLIADDHEVFRRGLRDVLSTHFAVVAEARDGAEAVEKALLGKPDVVVMDIRMPGMNGIEAARQIKARLPHTRIVVVSVVDDDQQVFEAIDARVTGYVLKDDTPQSMIAAVQRAAEGQAYLSPQIAKRVMDRMATGRPTQTETPGASALLTPREVAVLRLIAHGKRTRDVAEELGVSERTVGNYVVTIYHKLGVHNRAQAITCAITKGIIRL